MSQTYFITYADENYASQLNALTETAQSSDQFDNVIGYTRAELVKTEFYKKNKELLDAKPYAGWCAWKAFYILETLKKMQYGDVLLYIDAGDIISNSEGLREFLLNKTKIDSLDLILTNGAYPNRQYTKRDAFVIMDCNSEHYYNAIQVEAGIIVAIKRNSTMNIVERWLQFCLDKRVITDEPNVCGLPNFPEFIEGRADQSILSLIKEKYGIYSSDEMRRFVTCNVADNK